MTSFSFEYKMDFRKVFVGSPGNEDSITKSAKVPQAVQAGFFFFFFFFFFFTIFAVFFFLAKMLTHKQVTPRNVVVLISQSFMHVHEVLRVNDYPDRFAESVLMGLKSPLKSHYSRFPLGHHTSHSRVLLIYYKPRPRNYRVLHRALYNPRPQAEGCMLGVKPDNFEAEACNIFKFFRLLSPVIEALSKSFFRRRKAGENKSRSLALLLQLGRRLRR